MAILYMHAGDLPAASAHLAAYTSTGTAAGDTPAIQLLPSLYLLYLCTLWFHCTCWLPAMSAFSSCDCHARELHSMNLSTLVSTSARRGLNSVKCGHRGTSGGERLVEEDQGIIGFCWRSAQGPCPQRGVIPQRRGAGDRHRTAHFIDLVNSVTRYSCVVRERLICGVLRFGSQTRA